MGLHDGKETNPAEELLHHGAQSTIEYLERVLGRYQTAPQRLMDSIAYSLLAGGKRLRPALVLETWRMCRAGRGGSAEAGHRSALAAAGAVELIHTFSLVHDDLPAMDDDDLRRGRATNHKVFGEAMAILAGDAMTTMAFELIASDAEPRHIPRLALELAGASGPAGMIGGQVLDMDGQSRSLELVDLRNLHARKTGALLRAACRMGAIAADAEERAVGAVTRYGERLGLAFQIVDDILDVTATPEQLGKATHKDAGRGKNTYPVLLGLGGAKAEARLQMEEALACLEEFGAAAEGLRALVRFVVERQR